MHFDFSAFSFLIVVLCLPISGLQMLKFPCVLEFSDVKLRLSF